MIKYFLGFLVAAAIGLLGYAWLTGNPELPRNDDGLPRTPGEPQPWPTKLGDGQLSLLTASLYRPWALADLPDGDVLITQVDGKVMRLRSQTGDVHRIWLLPRFPVLHRGHLFDIALAPDFSASKTFFLSYMRYHPDGGRAVALMSCQLWIVFAHGCEELFVTTPGVSGIKHYGGGLAIFGEHLFLAVGEQFTRQVARLADSHSGKVLRLTLQGTIPDDNPTENAIFAAGFRNPQSLAQNSTGVWASEHGPALGDEINFLRPGLHYGWPLQTKGREYTGEAFTPPVDFEPQLPNYDFPETFAPSGLAFVPDNTHAWSGNLLVSGLFAGRLRRFEVQETELSPVEDLFVEARARLRDVHVRSNGDVLILTEDGRLFTLVPP